MEKISSILVLAVINIVSIEIEIHMKVMCICSHSSQVPDQVIDDPPFLFKCMINEKAEHISNVGDVIDAVEDYKAEQTERNSNVSPSEGETVKDKMKILIPKKRQSTKSDEVSSGATSNAIYPLNTSIFL